MAKKKNENSLTGKAKGLFDHINHIREIQSPNYIESLREEDMKTWSNFMICRFLSMDPNIIEYVNEIQRYSKLEPRLFYQLCIAITPRGRAFYPYIKKTGGDDYPDEVLTLLARHFEESKTNVEEYANLMTKEQLIRILKLYGKDDKEIEKLLD